MITNGYASVAQLLDELGGSPTGDDAKIERAIAAASRQIDQHCGQRFWQDATVKTRQFMSDDSLTVCVPDGISTTTGLVVKSDSADDGSYATTHTISTGFILEPFNAEDDVPARPYTEIRLVGGDWFPVTSYGRPNVQITAKFGWAAVPDDVTLACLIQSASLMKGTSSPGGLVELSGFDGTGLRVARLHPMAAALLEGFVRQYA